MNRTAEEIRWQGLAALRRELGRAGLVRFLQQFEHGRGDYTKMRQDWVEGTSLEELRELAKQAQSAKRRRPKQA